MAKVLVDYIDGLQTVLEYGPDTQYFDPSKVLWDERIDGPLPAVTLGGLVRQGNSLVIDAAKKVAHDALRLAKEADEAAKQQAALARAARRTRLKDLAAKVASLTTAERAEALEKMLLEIVGA